MFRDALERCAVLSTDATGAAIQPGRRDGGSGRGCRKGHFFTVVTDVDHVLIAFTPRHAQDAVAKLSHGFGGFLRSDASSVDNILDRGGPGWLLRPRSSLLLRRCGLQARRRPRGSHDRVRRAAPTTPGRHLATKALGYALDQEQELRRVVVDARLELDNARRERSLRVTVVDRKNWLVYGRDMCAAAAAPIFGVLACCRLQGVEPERYIDEVLRVPPCWPKTRYIELAPRSWLATRRGGAGSGCSGGHAPRV